MRRLIKDNRSDTKAGLPFLRDLPGIGELFGSRDKTHDRTELMVLLTPKVVRSPTDVQALTDELERKNRLLDERTAESVALQGRVRELEGKLQDAIARTLTAAAQPDAGEAAIAAAGALESGDT